MLLIIMHTTQHALTEANQGKFTVCKLPKTVKYRNKLVSRPRESIKCVVKKCRIFSLELSLLGKVKLSAENKEKSNLLTL